MTNHPHVVIGFCDGQVAYREVRFARTIEEAVCEALTGWQRNHEEYAAVAVFTPRQWRRANRRAALISNIVHPDPG